MQLHSDFMGIRIDALSAADAVEHLIGLARAGGVRIAVTANVHHLGLLRTQDAFRDVYRRADLVLADGMPIVWASRVLRPPLPGRVAGADLVSPLCRRAAREGLGVYFLGGHRAADLHAVIERMRRKHPDLVVHGSWPPFGFESSPDALHAILAEINAVKPDILFVGVGSPKQEYWMTSYAGELDAGVIVGVGAAIDLLAGRVRRAPIPVQKAGLEWAWRLAHEPRRLWRRYLVDSAPFFGDLLREVSGRPRVLRRRLDPGAWVS